MKITHQFSNTDTPRVIELERDHVLKPKSPDLDGIYFTGGYVAEGITEADIAAHYTETGILDVPKYNGKQLQETAIIAATLAALDIDAEIYDPAATAADTAWRPGLFVKAGAQLTHAGYWWLAKKSHLTTPDNAPGLLSNTWNKLGPVETKPPPAGAYPPWDTTGKTKYALGDRVTHNGLNWESTVTNNTSEPKPGEAKWKQL